MKKFFLAALALLLFAAPVWAAEVLQGCFTGTRDNERYVVSIKDAATARIDVFLDNADKQVGQYVFKDGRLWHLALYSPELDWQVTDFAEIVADLKSAEADPYAPHVNISFADSGRTVSHAGYDCRVYNVDDKNAGASYEVWLNNDQEVWKLSRILMMLFSDPRAPIGERDVLEYINSRPDNSVNSAATDLQAQKTKDPEFGIAPKTGFIDLTEKLGILRFGDVFKLHKVEHVAVADDFFDLPAAPVAK